MRLTDSVEQASPSKTKTSTDVSVAIVCIAPLRSGAVLGGTYSAALGESLQEDGVCVELWTRKSAEIQAELNVPVRQVWRSGALAWLDVLKSVIGIRPRIVHIQHYFFLFGNGAAGEISTVLLLLSLAMLGTRVVVTLHDVPGKDQITADYVKLHKYAYPAVLARLGIMVLVQVIGRFAGEIIVHNKLFAERLVSFGVKPEKINIIPHMPLRSKPFERSVARTKLKLDNTGPIVLFFGYATGYKGIDQLLDAFEILEKGGAAVRLLLGAGVHPKMGARRDYNDYYSAMKSRAGSIQLVDFIGFIDPQELDIYISAADLGILPYVEYHGASGPLYYYLSHERPVLVSTCISEHNPDFSIGTFGKNSNEIATTIMRFFEDASFRERVSHECAEARRALFSDASLRLTREVYSKSLDSPLPDAT